MKRLVTSAKFVFFNLILRFGVIIAYKSHKSRKISVCVLKFFETVWLDGTILPDDVNSLTSGHSI